MSNLYSVFNEYLICSSQDMPQKFRKKFSWSGSVHL